MEGQAGPAEGSNICEGTMATHFLFLFLFSFLYWQCCFDWEENVWKLKFLFLAKKLDQFWFSVVAIARLPYARHYKPRLVYFLPHFWKPFLCFQGGFFQKILSLCMVSVQELIVIKSGLWWRAYGSLYLDLVAEIYFSDISVLFFECKIGN